MKIEVITKNELRTIANISDTGWEIVSKKMNDENKFVVFPDAVFCKEQIVSISVLK